MRKTTRPFWYTRRPPAKGGSASSFGEAASEVGGCEAVADSFLFPTQRTGADRMPKFGDFFFDEATVGGASDVREDESFSLSKRLTAVFHPARPTIQHSTRARAITTQLRIAVQ